MSTTMEKAEEFFYAHADWGYDPKKETEEEGRRRGAALLAQAEARAKEKDWMFEWVRDPNGCSGCDCGSADCPCASGKRHRVEGCVCRCEHGGVAASLWGICEATAEYRRVVEAELALEGLRWRDNRYPWAP